MVLKSCTTLQVGLQSVTARLRREDGITAIEYAIIGVAMASVLFFIFDKGGFLKALEGAWSTMSTKITGVESIIK
ncbi:Flp family type IVb pilin [Enterobacteriaceae bacterium BIT-l23]|nr:Flp family type IVb pilin [Enterobacteriaceae bacterium BIT-l23]